ncbi:hypothetical protein ACWKWC_04645 [Geodermatophilus nigrescens]
MTAHGGPVGDVVVAVTAAGEVTITPAEGPGEGALPASADLPGGSLVFDIRDLPATPAARLHDPLACAGWLALVYGHDVAQAAWHTGAGHQETLSCRPGPLAPALARLALLQWLTSTGAGRLDPRALAAETAVVLDELGGADDDPDDADASPEEFAGAAGTLIDELLARLDLPGADPRLTPFRPLLLEAAALRPDDPEDPSPLGAAMPLADRAPTPPSGGHAGSGRVDAGAVAPGLVRGDASAFRWVAGPDRLWVSVPAAPDEATARRAAAAGGLHARAYAPDLSFPLAFVPLALHGDAFVGEAPLLALCASADLDVEVVTGDRIGPSGGAGEDTDPEDPAEDLLAERLAAAAHPPREDAGPARPTLAEALAAIEQEELVAEEFAATLADDARLVQILVSLDLLVTGAGELHLAGTRVRGRTVQQDVDDPALLELLLGPPDASSRAGQVPTLEAVLVDDPDGVRLRIRIAGGDPARTPALVADVTTPHGTFSVPLAPEAGSFTTVLSGEVRIGGATADTPLTIAVRSAARGAGE